MRARSYSTSIIEKKKNVNEIQPRDILRQAQMYHSDEKKTSSPTSPLISKFGQVSTQAFSAVGSYANFHESRPLKLISAIKSSYNFGTNVDLHNEIQSPIIGSISSQGDTSHYFSVDYSNMGFCKVQPSLGDESVSDLDQLRFSEVHFEPKESTLSNLSINMMDKSSTVKHVTKKGLNFLKP